MSNEMTEMMQRIIEQGQDDFAAQEVYSDWMPDDGPYTVLVSSYNSGEKEKNGEESAWWRLGLQILSPGTDLDKKDFGVMFGSKAAGFLKSAAATINGAKEDSYRKCIGIIAGSVGYLLNVNVKTNNKGYKNVTISEVVDDGTTEAVVPEEATEAVQ